MTSAAILNNPIRIAKLRALGVNEEAATHFDGLARLAAQMMSVPVAFINIVDSAKTWCKAAWGGEPKSLPHNQSLCASALDEGALLLITDAHADERFSQHPEVIGERQVAFYLGIVLKTSDGHAIGTLCVMDRKSCMPNAATIDMLRLLAEQVVKHIDSASNSRALILQAQGSRDQFLAMLAHELRAPLAPILSAVQLLNRPEITPEQRAWCQKIINKHVKFMGAIVDNLLSASLVSFGTIELELEPLQIQVLLDQALEINAEVISQRKHLVTVTLSDDLWVCADRIQCPLIVSNLLLNAAKYTAPGGQIFVDVETMNDFITIRVKDTGVGIAASDMQEIFQIFGQSKQPIDRAKGGMGLGLPLAKRLAELHGGSLNAHSDGIDKGSEFILKLKRVLPATSAPDHSGTSDHPVRSLDLLIVEDSVDTANALALYYQLSGHTTRIAYCAADAILMVTERQPDVVLSDVGLPDVDGYTLVANIRDISLIPNPTFVALTGYASDADKAAALAAGFDGHLSKPVDLAQLDEMLIRLRGTNR
ncbi:hypothetical protein ASG35_11330 [Burkholderia sp. Leaf177]|uniref:hybrid sensor histidine kinase/response regulator n=1 Tax=Burkholderia sp. Leaf177 TaxID=1736287 RepID=UPI0006FF7D3C|nr:ATP-binding protein [Burkholderia sp. Leaf177]KQR76881.1 hypothetical protein ASG35_11330 [Burkholderia sp. Leaf177]